MVEFLAHYSVSKEIPVAFLCIPIIGFALDNLQLDLILILKAKIIYLSEQCLKNINNNLSNYFENYCIFHLLIGISDYNGL